MSDFLLYAAGGLAMICAVAHNYLGAKYVVGPAETRNRSAKNLMHAIWFLSGLYWFAAGALLVAAPHLFSGDTRKWVVLGSIAVLGSGGLLNLIIMRGKHFGGYLLTIVCVLAFLGVSGRIMN